MANNRFNDERRWRGSASHEQPYDEEDREDRQNRVRNYDRAEMRDYGRRSVNQGNRLRSMRGGRTPGDYETDIGRTSSRGYGHQQDAGRNDPRREGGQYRSYPGQGADVERDPNRLDFDHDVYDFEEGYDRGRYREPGSNTVDNYWGQRQQNRTSSQQDDRDWDWVYRRNQGEDNWWNTTGGRPDYTSGRSYEYGRSTEHYQDREDTDSREFDMDPGFAYEFGTDYDFMADTNLRDFSQRSNRDQEERSRRRFGSDSEAGDRYMDPDYDAPGRGATGRGQQNWRPAQNRGGSRMYPGAVQNQGREQNRQPRRPEGRGSMEAGWDSGRGQGRPQERSFRYAEFWDVPGPFRGVGPKNYQRSDERIKDELYDVFVRNGQIDSSGIEIDVQNGEVTLSGDVTRRNDKYLAEDIASAVMGVRDVNNRIRVMSNAGARVRGMNQEDTVMPGRIQPGMRVAGVDGKHIGQIKEVRGEGFILARQQGENSFIPFRAVKRTNGQIILHLHENEIDQQGWKETR